MPISQEWPPSALDSFHDGNIQADGTEQTILEHVEVARISGYVNLTQMEVGDSVALRQYIRVRPSKPFAKYADESYSGKQTDPVLYIKPREADYGIKVTIQQTAGSFKSFDYNFIRER